MTDEPKKTVCPHCGAPEEKQRPVEELLWCQVCYRVRKA